VIKEECGKKMKNLNSPDVLLDVIAKPAEELIELGDTKALTLANELDRAKELMQKAENRENLGVENYVPEETVELKALPPHLKYSFVILSSSLTAEEERRLIEVLKLNQRAIGWQLSDLKGIRPTYCMHCIHMEADFKPVAQPHRRLNLAMKEVMKKEVQKLE